MTKVTGTAIATARAGKEATKKMVATETIVVSLVEVKGIGEAARMTEEVKALPGETPQPPKGGRLCACKR